MLLERAGQPQLIQRGRAQVVCEPPDVVDQALRSVPHHHESIRRAVRVGLHQPTGCLGTQPQPGDGRSDLVVEGSAQPATLLLAGEHQPLPGALQVLAQPELTRGGAHPAGQIVEQSPVGPAERLRRRARRDPQPTDALTPVDEWPVDQPVLGQPARPAARLDEGTAGIEVDNDIRDAQRVGDVGGHRREGVAVAGIVETAPEPAQCGVRIATVAVHELVDSTLQRDTQRIHGDGNHSLARSRRAWWPNRAAAPTPL